MDSCCDHLVIAINGLHEIKANYSTASQFHMYIFVNMKAGQNPENINVKMENIIIFQRVKRDINLFTIFERKWRDKMRLVSIWNGAYFLDNEHKRQKTLKRNFNGDILRVGSGPMMPWAFLVTLPNGHKFNGGGIYHEFLRVISTHDNITLEWVDVLKETGFLWGTLYRNGSSTGLVKLIMEHRVDIATSILCGIRLHRNLFCSTAFEFTGFVALLRKPQSSPSWMGMLSPFDKYTWLAILGSVIVTMFILGICMKQSVKNKKVDWTLHFLDALHPMCGRNMALPGLNAAHLGRE